MSKYSRGAAFERRVKLSYQLRGWYVMRSAGSKGLCDLIAFKGGEVHLLQLKVSGKMTPLERCQLYELARENKFQAILVTRDNKKNLYRLLFEAIDVSTKEGE